MHNEAFGESDFTLSLWVYWEGSQSDNIPLLDAGSVFNSATNQHEQRYTLMVNSDGRLRYQLGGTDGYIDKVTNHNVPKNKWVMYTLIKNSDSVSLYAGEQQIDTSLVSLGSITPSIGLLVDNYYRTTNLSTFAGKIDDIRIYSRALSEFEVQELYTQTIDTDNDGMPNDWENAYDLDPEVNDADLDGDNDDLSNLQEFNLGTSPNNSDTDGDGIIDGQDSEPLIDQNDTSLIAYYPLDGNANDQSGNGNNGSEYGAVSYVTGKRGQAASFDGLNDFISVSNFSVTLDDFSISLWLSTNSLPSWYKSTLSMHSGEPGYIRWGDKNISAGWLNSDASFGSFFATSNAQTGENAKTYLSSGAGSITPGDWYLMTYIRKGDSVYLYLNDTLVNSNSFSLGSFQLNNGLLEIGAPNYYGSGDGWSVNGRDGAKRDGKIDDIRIYSRALSEPEVRGLYNQSSVSPDIDTDNDGLPDHWETTYGLNPYSNDADLDNDKDGLSSLEEFTLGTDPTKVDSDNDGFPDSIDKEPVSPNIDIACNDSNDFEIMVIRDRTYQSSDMLACHKIVNIETGSDVLISTGADIRFQAPVIVLKPGFRVALGGRFRAGQ